MHKLTLPVAFLVLALAGCAGFAPDAMQRITITEQSATLVLNALANSRDQGLIDQTTLNEYKPVIDAFAVAKSVAERDLKAGDVTGYNTAINQLGAAYIQLRPLLAHIATARAATQPTTKP